MKHELIQKLIYQLVSKIFVLPIYKFFFKGQLIGRDNIPQKDLYELSKYAGMEFLLL